MPSEMKGIGAPYASMAWGEHWAWVCCHGEMGVAKGNGRKSLVVVTMYVCISSNFLTYETESLEE